MRFTPLLALSLASLAVADTPAKRTPHGINPMLLCGENFVDCANGWCCPSGGECTVKKELGVEITLCKADGEIGDTSLWAHPVDKHILSSAYDAYQAQTVSPLPSASNSAIEALQTEMESHLKHAHDSPENGGAAVSVKSVLVLGGWVMAMGMIGGAMVMG